jgi:hypothetical protein
MGVYTLYILLLAAVISLLLKGCSDAILKQPMSELDRAYHSFRFVNSPAPETMSVAVVGTKYPRLMTSIAISESNGNPSAIGDHGESKGAFQVQDHWGEVSGNITEQALQAEMIIEQLVASAPRRSLRHGLARYNGGNSPPRISFKYADRIMSRF